MAAQSLDNDFMKYWSMLTPVEKESLLTVAKNYVQLKDDNTHISIEQYNKEIEEAVERVQGGEFYTHEEIVEMSKDWINEKDQLG